MPMFARSAGVICEAGWVVLSWKAEGGWAAASVVAASRIANSNTFAICICEIIGCHYLHKVELSSRASARLLSRPASGRAGASRGTCCLLVPPSSKSFHIAPAWGGANFEPLRDSGRKPVPSLKGLGLILHTTQHSAFGSVLG